MNKFLLPVVLLALALVLSSCQGFFEDYSYSPLGAMDQGRGSSY